MPTTQFDISEALGELNKLAPTGYALGFHIEYTTPKFMFQTYKKDWLDHYSSKGLLMSDPMVGWGFENHGSHRWSALEDPAGVMTAAAEFGMPFGVVIALHTGSNRTICGFSHAEREFNDDEIAQMTVQVERINAFTADSGTLDAATVEQLKKMSIMVTHPGS